jgi:branched-chain amino acid transport system ATP-binding protein
MPHGSPDAILRVEGVKMVFGGLVALHDVSMQVNRNQIVGLIGPNGAGKTTLFNVITGFYKPKAGRVYFNGRDITGWPPHKIAKLGIARTFQIVKPFPQLTVEEAVRVGAYKVTKDEDKVSRMVDEALKTVGLEDISTRKCADCNLVQTKLTELARALATQPVLLLLDEVAAGLTPTEIDFYIDLLKRINKEKKISMLVVEHVMKFVMGLSERVVVLHYGKKISEGTPDEVSSDKQVIEAYLGKGVA